MLFFVYVDVFPVFARPDTIELRMGDTKLLGNHFQPVFVVPQQLLDNLDFAFGKLIVTGCPLHDPVLQIRILPVVLDHVFFRHPFQILIEVVQLIVIQVNNVRILRATGLTEMTGYELVHVTIQRLSFGADIK